MPLLPLREIFVPRRLLEAPPLYQWDQNGRHDDVDDDITCSGAGDEQEESNHHPADTADFRSHHTTTTGGKDQAPRLPSRGRHGLATTEQEQAVHNTLPPRRPRRSASPVRLMTSNEIIEVSLKPCQAMTDDEGHQTMVQVNHSTPVPLSQLLKLSSAGSSSSSIGHDGSNSKGVMIVFCIRNSACGSVRNHGLQLTQLAQRVPGLNLLGVIKADAQYEQEFYRDYFSFPLYTDETSSLFSAMGERKVSIWKMVKRTPKLLKTCHKKKIISILEFREDFWLQGGLLLFDSEQRLRFAYYEKFGDDLDLEALEWAIQQSQRPFVPRPEAAPVEAVITPETTFSRKRRQQQRPKSPEQSSYLSHSPWDSPPSTPPPRRPVRSVG